MVWIFAANLDWLGRKWRFCLRIMAGIAVASIIAPTMCYGGATAASWVVVVNGESQNSRTIANYYVKFRNIPPRNVIVLKGIPADDMISEKQFKEIILQPVLKA